MTLIHDYASTCGREAVGAHPSQRKSALQHDGANCLYRSTGYPACHLLTGPWGGWSQVRQPMDHMCYQRARCRGSGALLNEATASAVRLHPNLAASSIGRRSKPCTQ
jgi:hypothetical protein